jgi:hypothetical protein
MAEEERSPHPDLAALREPQEKLSYEPTAPPPTTISEPEIAVGSD